MNREQIQYFDAELLETEPQVRKRYSKDALAGLIETVKRFGLLAPIRVRRIGNGFVVVQGHLRLLAAKAAGLASVPCIIEERDLNEAEICERQLVENRRRQDLRPVEFAEAVERLMRETQWSASETAKRLGESPATITRHMALLKLPEDVRAKVDAGEIAASAAYKLAQVSDAAQQEQLADELSSGRLTRDGLNGKLKPKPRPAGKRQTATKKARFTAPLGGGRSITFSGPSLASVAELVAWLDELRAKACGTDLELAEFLKSLKRGA
jgi:ParB family chromosome partitioning protein